jgi:DNA-binding transcriptional regulator GbsR (MarR family)
MQFHKPRAGTRRTDPPASRTLLASGLHVDAKFNQSTGDYITHTETLAPAARRFIDFVGDLGGRWGLPADACRVHAYLYLAAKPVDRATVAAATLLDTAVTDEATAFLASYRVAEEVRPGVWRTFEDPWMLMVRSFEQRRRREMLPALTMLRECQRDAAANPGSPRSAATEIGKLLTLAKSISAFSSRLEHASPALLRGLLAAGGRAARLFGNRFDAAPGAEVTPGARKLA